MCACVCVDITVSGPFRCLLREDGTHWAYCTRFVEPDLAKRTLLRGDGGRGGDKRGGECESSRSWLVCVVLGVFALTYLQQEVS